MTIDGSLAGASAVGIRFGGTVYTAVSNVEIQSFQGAGIEIENTAGDTGLSGGLFTERYDLDATLWHNQIGLYYHCDAGCNVSFEHARIKLAMNILTDVATTTPPVSAVAQEGIKADGAALVANDDFYINGNVESYNTGAGGILFHAAGTSSFNANTYSVYPECNQTGCTRVKVDTGATFAGQFLTGFATANPWSDIVATGGTDAPFGFSTNNNGGQFNTGNITAVHLGGNTQYASMGLPPPTLSACGTSPSLTAGSTDAFGEIIFGTGTVPSCKLTFGTPYTVAVACNFTDDGNPRWYYSSAKSGTGVTINGGNCAAGNCAGALVQYHCFGIGGP